MWSWSMFKTCNFLILVKNLEYILTCNLIRTELYSEAKPATLLYLFHLKLCFFPIPYSRRSPTSCLKPHVLFLSFLPCYCTSVLSLSFLSSISELSAFHNFLAHHNILHCHMNAALCCPGERKPSKSGFHLKPLPHDYTGVSQPCKSSLDASST